MNAFSRPSSRPVAGTADWPIWHKDDGSPVSCVEKIRVMQENLLELRQMAQDAFEDALLMDVSEGQIRAALRQMIDALDNPYGGIANAEH